MNNEYSRTNDKHSWHTFDYFFLKPKNLSSGSRILHYLNLPLHTSHQIFSILSKIKPPICNRYLLPLTNIIRIVILHYLRIFLLKKRWWKNKSCYNLPKLYLYMIKVFSSLQLYVCMFIHAKKCLPRYVHMSYYYCPNKVQGEAKLKLYLGLHY